MSKIFLILGLIGLFCVVYAVAVFIIAYIFDDI